MIKNPFRKNQDSKKPLGTPETENVISAGGKGKSLKMRLVSALLVLAALSLGVAGSYFVWASKKPLHTNRQLSNLPVSNIGSNAWLSGQATAAPVPVNQPVAPQAVPQTVPQKATVVALPPVPVKVIAKKEQKIEPEVKVAKEDGRDVFKEFYFKHPLTSQGPKPAGKALARTLDTVLATMGTPSLGAAPELSMVHAINTPPASEPLQKVEIYGTTCTGSSDCVAITNEGTLRVGDKVGGETVRNVTKSSLTTDKRMVEIQ